MASCSIEHHLENEVEKRKNLIQKFEQEDIHK